MGLKATIVGQARTYGKRLLQKSKMMSEMGMLDHNMATLHLQAMMEVQITYLPMKHVMGMVTSHDVCDESWYMDSGASNHMMCHGAC